MKRFASREMKGFGAIGIVFVLLAAGILVALPGKSWNQITRVYGDVVLSGPWQAVYFDDSWDLTKGDLTISYTIDMNGATPKADWSSSWTSVGLWDLGWMCSGAPGAYYQNPNKQDICDKHNLQAVPGQGEGSYDVNASWGVTTPPIGVPTANYGIWFDRTGMDQWQVNMWGAKNGQTYNTNGLYDIVLSMHAETPTSGWMFNTVNDIQTGFYWTEWKNAQPESYPVGRTISGDLTHGMMAVWIWAPDATYGTVEVAGLTVTGYLSTQEVAVDIKPGSWPNSISLKDNGLLPVAILGGSELDVHDIDPETIQAGVDPNFVDLATRGPAKAPKLAYSFEDVNKDGTMDMMVFFEVQALVLEGGLVDTTTQLSITAELFNDVPIKGVDLVSVVP